MSIDVLSEIIEGQILNKSKNIKIKDIKIDSRKIKEGDVFVALSGSKFDGHDYIKDVIKKKPSAIVVCKKVNLKTKIPIILVEDTYDTLMKIGAFFRNKYDIPVIAITGSVGKTTTKEIIYDILSKKYKVLKSEKNYNNHVGLPLTLFKLNNSYDICLLEMGMNHLSEISKLSKMCNPNIGVITNIGTAHIGNLGSKKNILKAKLEITSGMKDGILLVNQKDKLLKRVKHSKILRKRKFLIPYDIRVNNGVSFKLKINKETHKFSYNIPNKNLIMNFVLAIEIGILFKIDINDIKDAISNYQMPKERMNVIFKNNTKIIDDCYNASLESTLSSIETLNCEKGKKIIILGDILELGKYEVKIHKKIEKKLKKLKDITVLLVGNSTKHIKGGKYKHFNDNSEIIKYLNQLNLNNASILIKGSRGMHLEEVTKHLLEIV